MGSRVKLAASPARATDLGWAEEPSRTGRTCRAGTRPAKSNAWPLRSPSYAPTCERPHGVRASGRVRVNGCAGNCESHAEARPRVSPW